MDAATGSVNVFRRRADPNSNSRDGNNNRQQHPKLMMISLDCSGSMYRFDGRDGRLQMVMTAAALMMEALDGGGGGGGSGGGSGGGGGGGSSGEKKVEYIMIGHSGESERVDLIPNKKNPPANEKERYNIIKKIELHSQFCASGDNTLETIHHCCQEIGSTVKHPHADDRIVIVVSDANFSRYGIPASAVKQALEQRGRGGSVASSSSSTSTHTKTAKVTCHLILIGGGEEALEVKKEVGALAHVCGSPQDLIPIFTSILNQQIV